MKERRDKNKKTAKDDHYCVKEIANKFLKKQKLR